MYTTHNKVFLEVSYSTGIDYWNLSLKIFLYQLILDFLLCNLYLQCNLHKKKTKLLSIFVNNFDSNFRFKWPMHACMPIVGIEKLYKWWAVVCRELSNSKTLRFNNTIAHGESPLVTNIFLIVISEEHI